MFVGFCRATSEMRGAPSFEVELSVATKMEKFNGRKQKLAKFSLNGRRTCAVRIKARSLPRQGLCLGAPCFDYLLLKIFRRIKQKETELASFLYGPRAVAGMIHWIHVAC